MEFAEVVRRRRMVRAFRPDPIPPDVLDRVLGAARRAPAAGNSDGHRLGRAGRPGADPSVLGHHAAARRRPATGSATRSCSMRPCSRSSLADRGRLRASLRRAGQGRDRTRRPRPIAGRCRTGPSTRRSRPCSMLLAATNEGLGALFFGIFQHEDELLAALGVPSRPPGHRHHRPRLARRRGGCVQAGSVSGAPRRVRSKQIVHRGRW